MTCFSPASLRRIGLFVFAFGAVRLVAQDVTVTPIAWVSPDDAPDTPPTLGSTLRPKFPYDLKKTTDIGWAMINFFVDDHGKVLSWQIDATQPAYAQAVEEASGERGKFKPARRASSPVNASVSLSILFNPASSASDAKDATPRLLDAAVIIDRSRATGPHQQPIPPQVIWVTVRLDENGEILELKDTSPEFQSLFAPVARKWRFAPARKAGVAVAAEVRVPFIVAPPRAQPSKNEVPPKWISRTPPVYPLAMRRSGLRGNVVVEFVVDIEGRVREPVVVRTLNPAFNEAALTAIRRWKFEPARSAGVPVNCKMQQPISFSLDMFDGGGDGLEVRHRANQDKLPEELRYDVAPALKALVTPIYPYALLRDHVKGTASVSMLIGPDGRVMGSKIVKADRPELGYALQASVDLFEYSPALKAARPTQALLRFEQEFGSYNDTLVSEVDRTLLRLEEKHPERILKSTDLDERLKPTVTRLPVYPRSLRGEPPGSSDAVIDFLVNEDGSVHLPRIVSATKPEFGYAAVQAVSTWQFAPPHSKGKPGVTRVRVPISFKPVDDTPAADKAPPQP